MKTPEQIEDENSRTTALGLYHYARSFRAAATKLTGNLDPKDATHPDAPLDHLLIHAIELYLKAYLRQAGASVADLKRIGHDMPRLGRLYEDHGGQLGAEDQAVIALLTPENVFGARYLETGAYTRAPTEALMHTADNLHGLVRDKLRAEGTWCAP
jgi:hypothetical protein